MSLANAPRLVRRFRFFSMCTDDPAAVGGLEVVEQLSTWMLSYQMSSSGMAAYRRMRLR